MAELAEPLVVVTIRALLIPLAALAGYFVAWGLVFVMDAVVRSFFGTAEGLVGWVPFAGKLLESPLIAIEHKLTSFLGGMETQFEHQFATRWHAHAHLVEQLAQGAGWGAYLELLLARKLAALWSNHTTSHVVRDHAKPGKIAQAQTTTVTNTIIRVEKVAGSKADAGVARAVGVLEGELGQVLDWTIPGLRDQVRGAEDSLGRLWKRVRGETRTIGISAGVALVTAALSRLGLGRLGCLNRKNALKTVCGMNPNLLESLLADTLLILGTLSLVEFATEMVDVTAAAVTPIQTFWRAG
jgi:hypothetical protein